MYLLSSNKIKKIIVLILSFLFVLPCLVSCENKNESIIKAVESDKVRSDDSFDKHLNSVWLYGIKDEYEVLDRVTISFAAKENNNSITTEEQFYEYYDVDYPSEFVDFYSGFLEKKDGFFIQNLSFLFIKAVDSVQISITDKATNHKYYRNFHVVENTSFFNRITLPTEEEIINSELYEVLNSFKSVNELKDEDYIENTDYNISTNYHGEGFHKGYMLSESNYEVKTGEDGYSLYTFDLMNIYPDFADDVLLPEIIKTHGSSSGNRSEYSYYYSMYVTFNPDYESRRLYELELYTEDYPVYEWTVYTHYYLEIKISKKLQPSIYLYESYAYNHRNQLFTMTFNGLEFVIYKDMTGRYIAVGQYNGFNYIIKLNNNIFYRQVEENCFK